MKPEFITFTGVDNWTSIDGMSDLSSRYPIEWGVLFSPKRQGVDPRYPGNDTMSRLAYSGLRLAAHLCGDYARGIMDGRSFVLGKGVFSRVQVNHPEPIPAKIAKLPARGIAQARGEEFPTDTSVDWLCDASGGRGLARTSWPRHPGYFVGYAGGFNPVNVREAIHVIAATGPYWIDMESGVRTDDRFDLEKCRSVCEQVYGSAA